MNILLVSQCNKNALTQTRRILDQFAIESPRWKSLSRARHRLRRSLFSCRTADPSHTAATMWPKHAPATSAPTTNLLCCPRGFHVHASTVVPMCLHHAHLLPPARPVPPLRRVRRALIAIQPKGERAALGEKCFCRQKTQISRRLLTSVEAW